MNRALEAMANAIAGWLEGRKMSYVPTWKEAKQVAIERVQAAYPNDCTLQLGTLKSVLDAMAADMDAGLPPNLDRYASGAGSDIGNVPSEGVCPTCNMRVIGQAEHRLCKQERMEEEGHE